MVIPWAPETELESSSSFTVEFCPRKENANRKQGENGDVITHVRHIVTVEPGSVPLFPFSPFPLHLSLFKEMGDSEQWIIGERCVLQP